ncbi:MAG TPA: sigma-54 dependent transcriptional regulator [Vicinamibacterales bacterium]|nr:sigma-54 dependent transcriptional regulator [Vicinamibacterales bacterium]
MYTRPEEQSNQGWEQTVVMDVSRTTVLVVEDEAELRQTIVESLEAEGFAVAQSSDANDALERLEGFAYDGLVVDLRLGDADGMDVLEQALARYPEIRAVVITGFGGVEEAVRAIKRGAVEFLIKPFQLVQLVQVIKTSISEKRLLRENAELRAKLHDRFRFGGMVGGSKSMKHVFSTLELVAPMNSTVLIQGETGTGKELIAKTIHYNSPRKDQTFVAFNAAAIPESLAETELFGHVKGAFTGAINARVGRFELADRGTLFIDEVASMSMSLQAKLLRVLQEREVERVGTSKPVKIDTRIIAASNVNLHKMVREGNFREDLYYRLNVVRVALPPLRARVEDIPMLSQHFVLQSCKNNNIPARTLAQSTLRLLMQNTWPGNIRQLENAIEAAVAMSGASNEILPEMLPEEIRTPERSSVVPSMAIPDEGINFVSVMSQVEKDLILQCLERTGGNRRQAARLLNLSRTTLIDKLHRLGIDDTSAA